MNMETDINLGKKLTQTNANIQLITLKISLRLALTLTIVFAGLKSNPPNQITTVGAILTTIMIFSVIIWILFPLLHLKDYIIFYEKGIEFNKQKWTLEELGNINFLNFRTNTSFFTRKYIETDVKDFNITYLKDTKKYFNKAYLKTN